MMQREAAIMMKVSQSTVSNARQVLLSENDEIINAVIAGEMTVIGQR